MIHTKNWGTTEPLIQTPLCELHRIVVRPGGYCSVHKHHGRANVFYVISGSLEVRIFEGWKAGDGNAYIPTELLPGQHREVLPGYRHQFFSPHGAVVLELYYPVLRGEDIERESEGGIEPPDMDVPPPDAVPTGPCVDPPNATNNCDCHDCGNWEGAL